VTSDITHARYADGDATPEAGPAPAGRRQSWLNLPSELSASLLAITTVPISTWSPHFPPWAVFISWAGTFAAGGPKRDVIRKLLPVQVLGSFTAMLIVLLFNEAAEHWSGTSFTIAQMVILGVLNSSMILVGRLVPALSFVPGMFFGFATYFATYFGGFGLHAQDEFASLWAAVAMNALGVLYAWLQPRLTRPADQHH
jgi:hypothetical protein